jgi:hypothetical protein
MEMTKEIAKALTHPIGKYVIMMGKPKDGMFLLENCNAFGAPSEACDRLDADGNVKYSLKANPIKYFDTKEECVDRLKRIMYGWRCEDFVYRITPKGFRLVAKGRDVKN